MRRTRGVVVLVGVVGALVTGCGDDGGDAASPAPTTEVPAATETTSETAAATTDPEDTCPEEDFLLEVNDATQPDGYGDPELAVNCDGTTMTVTSNALIAYEFVQITPNDLVAQQQRFEIPLTPVEAAEPGAMGLGSIGVAINGIPFFAAFEAPRDGYRDPLLDGLLDVCNGHTAPQGLYHYHAMPACLVDPEAEGVVVGYLFDGYELVTPYDGGTEVTSSYVRIDPDGLGAFDAFEYQEGAGDLDECNGMVGSDGVYRYFVTDAFPYLPFCYHGESSAAQGAFTGEPPAGG